MVVKFPELQSFVFQDMLKYQVWSWEKNKKFELALLEVNEDEPDRWDKIAKIVGGVSAKEVEQHYKALVQDLSLIESGLSLDEYNEHSDLVELERIQTLVTTSAPLGLCLSLQHGASLLELLTRLNSD